MFLQFVFFMRRDLRRLLMFVSPLRGFALGPLASLTHFVSSNLRFARNEAIQSDECSFGPIRIHSVRDMDSRFFLSNSSMHFTRLSFQ